MANQELTNEEISILKTQLFDPKAANRRRAARKIGKLSVYSLKSELMEAFSREITDSRTWETQVEMVRSLGRAQVKEAISMVEKICLKNKELLYDIKVCS